MEWQAREALAAESGQALARRTQRLLYDTERASLEAELSTIEDKLAAQVFGESRVRVCLAVESGGLISGWGSMGATVFCCSHIPSLPA